MARMQILYNAASDKATLAGGSWLSSMPLTNLQNGQVSKVARTTALTWASTQFTVDLGTSQRIDFIALVGHNLTPTDTMRFRIGEDPTWAAGTISLVTGFAARPMDGGRMVYVTPNPSPVGRYMSVEMRSTAPAGYVQIGRFMAGQAFSPAINFSWGAGFQWVDESTFARSVGGQTYADVHPKYRRLTCAFDALSDAEAWGDYPSVYDMMKTLGTTGNLFAIYDPDDATNALGSFMLPRRSIYGRLAELAPLTEIMPDAKPHTWALTVEELL